MTQITDLKNEQVLDRFEAHLVAMALASVTVINYLADLRAFVRWLSQPNGQADHLLAAGVDDLRAYLAYLKQVQRYAPSTINRHLQSLRKFYGFARQQGWTASNPAKELKLLPAGQEAKPLLLEAGEIADVLRAARHSGGQHASRDEAILRLLVEAGLKVGELISLQLDDLDRVGSMAYVYPCRTASPRRRVPLPPDAWAAVERYLSQRPTAGNARYVFISSDGSPISVRVVQRLVAAHARTAGLDGVTPQTLRYAYAHHLMGETGDLALVMQRLGHKNTAITARYLRPRPRRRRRPSSGQQTQPRR
jgi:integrase/recombinase XerC